MICKKELPKIKIDRSNLAYSEKLYGKFVESDFINLFLEKINEFIANIGAVIRNNP